MSERAVTMRPEIDLRRARTVSRDAGQWLTQPLEAGQAAVLALQRTAGNAAVSELLTGRHAQRDGPPANGPGPAPPRASLLGSPLHLDVPLLGTHVSAAELLGYGLAPATIARLMAQPPPAPAAAGPGAETPAAAGGAGATGAGQTGGGDAEEREILARGTFEATGAQNQERKLQLSVVAENLFPGRRGSPLNFGDQLDSFSGRLLPSIEAGIEIGAGEGGGVEVTPRAAATLYQISLGRISTTVAHQVELNLRERSAQTGIEVEHVLGEEGGAQFSAFTGASMTVTPRGDGVDVGWSGEAGIRIQFDVGLSQGKH